MCIWVCARAYESCCCLSISGCINLAFKIHSGAVLFVTWNDFSMATTLVSPVINCLSLYLPLVAIWLVKPRCSRPPCETTLIFEAAICILLPPVSNLLQAPGPCVFFSALWKPSLCSWIKFFWDWGHNCLDIRKYQSQIPSHPCAAAIPSISSLFTAIWAKCGSSSGIVLKEAQVSNCLVP